MQRAGSAAYMRCHTTWGSWANAEGTALLCNRRRVMHGCRAGSHHFVCCEGISTPDEEHSPHGNRNPLADVIARASSPDNPSWCTCSEEVGICSDLRCGAAHNDKRPGIGQRIQGCGGDYRDSCGILFGDAAELLHGSRQEDRRNHCFGLSDTD